MVRLRLRRIGAKKQPSYRIVAADKESPRDGRFLEALGHYNPRTEPSTITLKEDRIFHWLSVGAQPSEAVERLFTQMGTDERYARYKDGEDISSETRERAVAGLKELGIEFFGYGTLDVEPNTRSAVSGNMRVTATVKGQVLDLRDRFATTAASVSPQQADGEGNNETVARGNALQAAAGQAAATIVHQLRSKGL